MRGIFQKYFFNFLTYQSGINQGLSTNQAIYSAFSIEMYRHILSHSSTA